MNQQITDNHSSSRGHRTTPATIYDIAKATGVHPSTVSRALGKPGRVNAKTEKRIREAAARLEYRINPMARALPTGQTGTLGLVISDITNPVYYDLLRTAGAVTAAEGYTLVLADSQESAEVEFQTIQRLLISVDGLLLVGTRLAESDIKDFAQRKPLIVVNRSVREVASVVPNVSPGITAALGHLSHLGHSSIAFLSGPANSWMNRVRWASIFAEALNRSMNVVRIGPCPPTLEGGRTGLERIRASGATAVVTYNDLMAIGLLTACQEADIRCPEDLSIVGFDDIFGTAFTSPPLTTISTPIGRAGEHAVQQLLDFVRGSTDPTPVELATELVKRSSTAPPAVANKTPGPVHRLATVQAGEISSEMPSVNTATRVERSIQ